MNVSTKSSAVRLTSTSESSRSAKAGPGSISIKKEGFITTIILHNSKPVAENNAGFFRIIKVPGLQQPNHLISGILVALRLREIASNTPRLDPFPARSWKTSYPEIVILQSACLTRVSWSITNFGSNLLIASNISNLDPLKPLMLRER
ncbi:hypothetical protein AYI68_g2109 [Smittium mucronatum]|uniref:Uncharacterized protein n=1 Tax=Smittium mucronatum TaxID=133383 RepID=A0A1R0H3P0_9FUNG|nr:hypothetical protein AYI68_g2109 [Smittium mucronatum]